MQGGMQFAHGRQNFGKNMRFRDSLYSHTLLYQKISKLTELCCFKYFSRIRYILKFSKAIKKILKIILLASFLNIFLMIFARFRIS